MFDLLIWAGAVGVAIGLVAAAMLLFRSMRWCTLDQQARAALTQGDYTTAEQCYLQALGLAQRAFGNATMEATSRCFLAVLYMRMGRMPEAYAFIDDAKPVIRRALNNNPSWDPLDLGVLVRMLLLYGDYQDAELMAKYALTCLGDGSVFARGNAAIVRLDLARCYRESGRIHEALSALRQVELSAPALPDAVRDSLLASVAEQEAAIHLMRYDYARVEDRLAVSRNIRMLLHGDGDFLFTTVLAAHARYAYQQGMSDKAEVLVREALRICAETHGPSTPIAAEFHLELARIYALAKKTDAAELSLTFARKLFTQTFAGEPVIVMAHLAFVEGLINMVRRNFADAEHAFVQAQEIVECTGASAHPLIIDLLPELADAYRAQGKIAQADRAYHLALKITKQALGECPRTAQLEARTAVYALAA